MCTGLDASSSCVAQTLHSLVIQQLINCDNDLLCRLAGASVMRLSCQATASKAASAVAARLQHQSVPARMLHPTTSTRVHNRWVQG